MKDKSQLLLSLHMRIAAFLTQDEASAVGSSEYVRELREGKKIRPIQKNYFIYERAEAEGFLCVNELPFARSNGQDSCAAAA